MIRSRLNVRAVPGRGLSGRLAPAAAFALAGAFAWDAAAPASAQTASDPLIAEGVEVVSSERIRAKVLTVDPETRDILLRNLDTGEVFLHREQGTSKAPINIRSGDTVQALITRAVAARPADDADLEKTEVEHLRAPADQGDTAVGGRLTRTVVVFKAWNAKTSVAVGEDPEGRLIRYHIESDEGRAFMETLTVGEKVDVEISETVVITLRD